MKNINDLNFSVPDNIRDEVRKSIEKNIEMENKFNIQEKRGTKDSLFLKDVSKHFKVFAITIMYCEETFFLETDKDCIEANNIFGGDGYFYPYSNLKDIRNRYINTIYKDELEEAPKLYIL